MLVEAFSDIDELKTGICVHELDKIETFINSLIDIPVKEIKNEELYLMLKNKINVFLLKNNHISKHDLLSIIKLYLYHKDNGKNAMSDVLGVFSLYGSFFPILIFFVYDLQIEISLFVKIVIILVYFLFCGFIIYSLRDTNNYASFFDTKYKILYTCSIILEDTTNI